MRIRDLMLAAFLAGCGGGGNPPQPDPFPSPDMTVASSPDLADPPSPSDMAQAAVSGDMAQPVVGDMAQASSPDLLQPVPDMVQLPDLTPCTGGTLQICNSVCVNLSNDPRNCGACLNDCGSMTCSGGRCI